LGTYLAYHYEHNTNSSRYLFPHPTLTRKKIVTLEFTLVHFIGHLDPNCVFMIPFCQWIMLMPRGICGEIEPCYMYLHVCEGVMNNLFLLAKNCSKEKFKLEKNEF